MNVLYVKFKEAVRVGKNSDEVMFAMDDKHQIRLDSRTGLLNVMNKITNQSCVVPMNNVLYMYEKLETPSLERNAAKK